MGELSEKFWRKWLSSDELTRYKMVWHLAERIDKCSVIDDYDIRIHCIASLLKSYFEDLEKVIEKVIQ